MMRTFGPPPSAAEIETLARAALERLPEQFRRHLGDIVLQVEDFAEDDVLADLGIEDPFELSGLYEGRALTEKSIEESGSMPDRIFLYRRPLLDEWAERGDVTMEDLVTHVLVHEAGHHFGLSDDDLHALEDAAG
ncbi:metallopeptidase family protein [Tsuneonella sp. HG222]